MNARPQKQPLEDLNSDIGAFCRHINIIVEQHKEMSINKKKVELHGSIRLSSGTHKATAIAAIDALEIERTRRAEQRMLHIMDAFPPIVELHIAVQDKYKQFRAKIGINSNSSAETSSVKA